MKILEIQLHNINSLKSKTPISVDFTSDIFKDVGLYAITGVTGAGKTTLLDAITIALYNQVPRFNGISRGLDNVISYGATSAFSRVVFKNGTDRYEAYWGMSLVTKTGKKRTTPDEKVSFKNLTTGEILGEKKREVKEQVELVTCLNYDQFLRSVLLAQGEFAAFLSAKGPEKAKLLEQITGEVIYKRIGETIQRRKAEETRVLEDLKLTVDTKNLLTDEEILQKKEELKNIIKDVTDLELEEKKCQKINQWYQSYDKLENVEKDLVGKQKSYQEWVANHQQKMDLLKQDTQALPFKELVHQLEKEENNLKNHHKEFLINKNKFGEVDKQLSEQNKMVVAQKSAKEFAEKSYKDWEPKFSTITTLETEMEGALSRYKVVEKDEKEQINQKDKLAGLIQKNKEGFEKIITGLVPLEKYLNTHKHLPVIEESLSDWMTLEVELSKDKKQFQELSNSQKNITNDLKRIASEKENLEKKVKVAEGNYTAKQKELESLEKELTGNHLNELLADRETTSKKLSAFKEFNTLAENALKNKKNQEVLKKSIADLDSEIKELNATISHNEKDEKHQQQSVLDAEKIYKQESLIINLSKEREALVAGEPCKVCGSTEHPFVEKYHNKTISASEKELEVRKEKLKIISEKINQLKTSLEAKKPLVVHYKSQLSDLEKEHQEFISLKASQNIPFEFSEKEKVEKEIKTLEGNLESIDAKIKKGQARIEIKNKLQKEVSNLLETVNALKTSLAERVNTEKNKKEALGDLKKSLDTVQKSMELLTEQIQTSFEEKNVSCPKEMTIKAFLEQLKLGIQEYNAHKQKVQELKEQKGLLKVALENDKKSFEQYQSQILKNKEELEALKNTYKEKEAKRIALLPKEISVAQQRKILEEKRTLASNNYDTAVKKESDLREQKITLSTNIAGLEKQIKAVESVLKEVKKEIETKLETSLLNSIEEVKKALLSEEERLKFQNIEKNIHDKKLELKAWIENNQKEKKVLEKEKNFETTREEVQSKLKTISETKGILAEEKGKIQEQFLMNDRLKSQNKEVVSKINQQEKEVSKWGKLLKVLGGSKDAFNIYVQRLTLKSLIDLANIHLYKLNKRYSLQLEASYSKGEELNFKLMDHYQADQTRYVDTSSGGEKFLISLALALGLSDLASNHVKIESLFIDEGFGTLDGNTLETVVSTLENLQSQGKIIGVISHVESLKERIGTQIQIHKKGEGVSELKLVQ